MKTIIHSTGGTGITNFEARQLPLYERAIKESKVRNMFISDRAIENVAGRQDLYSLHRTNKSTSITKFWAIFDELKEFYP